MTLLLDAVDFAYRKEKPVLRGVSLRFEGAGIAAVVGPNGAGKTTLLRLMLGLLRPGQGRVCLDGVDVAGLSGTARAKRIAYIAQRCDLSAAFRVREVVALGRFAVGPNDEAVQRALIATELLDLADEPFATLSAGQQQRVSLARVIAQLDTGGRPANGIRFLLADEPFAAMDPAHVAQSISIIKRLAAEGVGIVMIVHDLTLAAGAADRAIVLDSSGRVASDGSPDTSLGSALLTGVFGVGMARVETEHGPAIVTTGTTRPTLCG